MKFHCDRCNTRYSIADERVRGKILKVRCKGCSAVITVRESASEAPDSASPGHDEGGNAPPRGSASQPVVRAPSQPRSGLQPRQQTGPQPRQQTGPQTVPQPRQQTGPQTVPQPRQQTGPQTVPQPRQQTGPQTVPQLRQQTGPQTVPQPRQQTGPQAAAAPARRSASQPAVRAPSQLQSGAGAAPSRTSAMHAAVGARQETVRPPPPGASQSQPVWHMSRNGEQAGPLSLAGAREWIVSNGGSTPLYCWREGFADWQVVTAVPEFRDLAMPRAQSQPPRAPRPVSQPRPPSTTTPAPAQVSRATEPAALPARPSTPGALARPEIRPQQPAEQPDAQPVAQPVAQPIAQPVAQPVWQPIGQPESSGASQSAPVVLASSGSVAKLSDDAFGAVAEDDLDLAIEEPSRIVKLDVLEAYRNASAAKRRGTANLAAIALPGEPGGSEQDSQVSKLGRSTGSVTALVAVAGTGRPVTEIGHKLDDVRATDKRRRSSMPLIIGVVGVLCAGATALAVMILRAPGKSEEGGLSANVPSNFENLGYQVERPDRRTVGKRDQGGDSSDTGDTTGDKASGTADKTPRRRSGSSPGASSTSNASGTGNRVDPSGDGRVSYTGEGAGTGALTPLSPDDIIRQSSRSQFGFERCYERAKKKDPFFEVKSVTVDLEVNAAGKVSRVALSNYEDTVFGTCMTARVQQWTFRASTNGIRTKLPIKFEQ
jgi:predicted Zn finger-like uncharacterized protein